jgi:hypothetical protein
LKGLEAPRQVDVDERSNWERIESFYLRAAYAPVQRARFYWQQLGKN